MVFQDHSPAPSPHADIITLSSGERINPNPIEERVKRYIPIVRYVVLVGQDAPYLCALLTLKVPRACVFEPRGNPGCRLDGACCPGFKMGKLRLGEERQWVGHSVPSLGYPGQAPWGRSSWPVSRERAAGPEQGPPPPHQPLGSRDVWGKSPQVKPVFSFAPRGWGPGLPRAESDG